MNTKNHNYYQIADIRVFTDLYESTKEVEYETKHAKNSDHKIPLENKNNKLLEVDLSSMPSDIISCVSKHLSDYKFDLQDDLWSYQFFFKFDKPTDCKEYIVYITSVNNYCRGIGNDTIYDATECKLTESNKTDLSIQIEQIKQKLKKEHQNTWNKILWSREYRKMIKMNLP